MSDNKGQPISNIFDQELEEAMKLRESGHYLDAAARLAQLRMKTSGKLALGQLSILEASCWRLAGDFQKARTTLSNAARFYAGDRSVRLRIEHETARLERSEGDRLAALNRTKRILDEYKSLLETTDYLEVQEELKTEAGLLLSEMGRCEGAIPLLLASRRADSDVLYSLGDCYFRTNCYREAIDYLRKALDLNLAPQLVPAAKYLLAFSYYKLGAFAQVISVLEPVDIHSNSASNIPSKGVYEMLADSFLKLGMETEARQYQRLVDSG